jgi:AmiR/NasT family two-component response regulator
MATRRVFVIWTHPLFRETVSLLLRHPLVELVGTTNDHSAARSQIIKAQPDVVIIEQNNDDEHAGEETVAILQHGPKVVRLSLADNELSIYLRELRTVEKVADLVWLIIGDPGSEQSAEAAP